MAATASRLQRRRRLRADDGDLEPARRRHLSSTGWRLPPGMRWIDVGCGNGAFTERADRSDASASANRGPRSVRGTARFRAHAAGGAGSPISPGRRHGASVRRQQLRCRCHGAGDLLCSRTRQRRRRDGARGAPGRHSGRDLCLGCAGRRISPWSRCGERMRAMGITPMGPPRPEASSMDGLRDLWTNAGLEAIETREITVQRTL